MIQRDGCCSYQTLRLNKTMTSSQVVALLRASVGDEKTRTCHAEDPRAKSANSRSPVQKRHAEPVRIRRSCPCFRCLEDRSGVCHVAPEQESGCFCSASFRFSTVIFQTKPQGPSSNPTHQSELNCKGRRRRTNIQDDVQEAGRRHP